VIRRLLSGYLAVNRAIDGVIESNQKARSNPKASNTLDSYKRGLVNSLTGVRLDKFKKN
jgi:hypothetical protein